MPPSCAATDIANVVEGISWNTCFTHLQWYRKDICFPIRIGNPDGEGVMPSSSDTVIIKPPEMSAIDRCTLPTKREKINAKAASTEEAADALAASEEATTTALPLLGLFGAECESSSEERPTSFAYGTASGPFSLFDNYWRSRLHLHMQDADQMGQPVLVDANPADASNRVWYEERMARAFAAVSVSEVVWLITYVSKAIAYMRVEMWVYQNGSKQLKLAATAPQNQQQQLHSAKGGKHCQSKEQQQLLNAPAAPVAVSLQKSASMSRALRSIVQNSEDLRQMSDAARFVSSSVNNHSRLWVKAGMQGPMGPLYAHLSCRLLELAALMDEEEEASSTCSEQHKQQKQQQHNTPMPPEKAADAPNIKESMFKQCPHSPTMHAGMGGGSFGTTCFGAAHALSYPSPYYYLSMNSPMHSPTTQHRARYETASFPSYTMSGGIDASYEYVYPEN